jgi:hypothetical protein
MGMSVNFIRRTKKINGYASESHTHFYYSNKKVLFSGGGYLHQPAPAPILFWTEVTAPQNAGKSAALKPRKKSILEL